MLQYSESHKDSQVDSVLFEPFQEGILRLETPKPVHRVQAGVPGAQEVICVTQKIMRLSPQSHPMASLHPASPGLVCVFQRGVTSGSARGPRVLVDGQVTFHLLFKTLNNFYRAVLVSQQNRREGQRFPVYPLLLPHCPRPPPAGTSATIDDPALARHCHPEPSVGGRVRAWRSTSCGCGRVSRAPCPPSQCHTGQPSALEMPCAPPIRPARPLAPATSELCTVSLVGPFPEQHVFGITRRAAASDRPLSLRAVPKTPPRPLGSGARFQPTWTAARVCATGPPIASARQLWIFFFF